MRNIRIDQFIFKLFGYDQISRDLNSLQQWRELTFEILLNVSLPIGFILYLVNMISLVIRKEWVTLVVITVFLFGFIAVRFLSKKVSYRTRVILFLSLFYLIAMYLGMTKPTIADGRVWMIFTVIATAIFLGGRGGIIALGIVFTSWLGLGFLFEYQVIAFRTDYLMEFTRSNKMYWWINTSFVLLGIGLGVIASMEVIIMNLTTSLEESRTLTKKLEEEIRLNKQTERELRKSKDRYRDLLYHSPQLVMELNYDFDVLDVNPAMEKSLGFLGGGLKGKNLSEVLQPDIYQARKKKALDAIEKQKTVYFEDQRGARHFFTIIVPNPVRETVQVISLDITERKQAEIQVKQHQKELEAKVKARTEKLEKEIRERKQVERRALAAQKLADLGLLTTGIAHELNSPLQGIMITSDYLLMKLEKGRFDKQSFQDRLEIIKLNVKRCAQIVDSLRYYAHETPEEIQPYSLKELIKSTLMLIEHQFENDNEITIETRIEPDLPHFCCDRDRMMQVFINLLTNARDAMPEGGKIQINVHYDQAKKEFVIQVVDSGKGIPDEIKEHVFVPFFTTKPVGKGTGLGLYIVSGIVRARGGDIQMKSTSRDGTTFELTFPEEPVNNPMPVEFQGRFGYIS
jgi:PAS domain S-box-containing protein